MTRKLSIVADEQIPFAEELFSRFGDVNLFNGRFINEKELKYADILLVRSVTKVDQSLLKNTEIKFVGSATSGIDHIDVDYLTKKNVFFSHAPGCNADSVAEYVLNSLITLTRSKKSHFSLSNKKVGIIGYGNVGSRVKRLVDIFGADCILNDPPLFDLTNDKSLVSLEQVLQSDIITFHVPLIRGGAYPTYNLVGDKLLKKLKSNIFFINTSRGEVIDENALLSFKKSNPESTLVLDVWRNEPNINLNLLKEASLATPHIAGYSYEAKIKAAKMLFNSLNGFLKTDFDCSDLLNCGNIDLIPENDDPNFLFESIISQHWHIVEDSIPYEHYSTLSNEERSIFYDNLRSNYRIRHEFTKRVIDMSKCNYSSKHVDEAEEKLKKLGFELKNI